VRKSKIKSNLYKNCWITPNRSSYFTEHLNINSVLTNSIKSAITSKVHSLSSTLSSRKLSADSLPSNGIKQMISLVLMIQVVRSFFLWIWCKKWIWLKSNQQFTVIQILVQDLVMGLISTFLTNATKTVNLIQIFHFPIIWLNFHTKTVNSHTMLSAEQ